MPWLLPVLPLVGSVAIIALKSSARPSRRVVWLAVVAEATLAATLAVAIWSAVHGPAVDWPWWGPRLRPGLSVDGLSRVMVVLVPVIAIPVVSYAASSMRQDSGLPRLLALLVGFVGAMELLVSAADLLTLLVGWELVSVFSWALIGYEWHDADRVRAARDAFLTTRAGDLGLYLAAAAAFSATGSVRFDALVGAHGVALHVVAAGVLLAAAAKSAQLPFSPWLFAAMAGPTPASALLHSATMVAAGAYALARLAPALAPMGWFGPAVAALGVATALAGGAVAALQSDIKKALAASTSAQYGFMFAAIGAGFPAAAGLHLVAHAAFKALLFLCAGLVLHAAGTGDLGELPSRRLGEALPRVAGLFAVGTLALAGIPPLGAAYSKEKIFSAAVHSGSWLALGVLVAGLLSVLYAGRLQLLAFGFDKAAGRARAPDSDVVLPSPTDLAGPALLAGLSVALGLLWLPGAAQVTARATGNALPRGAPWVMAAALMAIVLAAAACWALQQRGKLFGLGLANPVRTRAAAWLGLPIAARYLVVVPVLVLARSLARLDDRVVDAGIRGAGRVGLFVSRAFAWRGELLADGVVNAVTRAANATARASREADDRGVDGAVERLAEDVGIVGRVSRRLQTGFVQQYYILLAIGVVVAVAAAAVARIAAGR